MAQSTEAYMQKAIDLATENVRNDGGPFGAIVVAGDGSIVGESGNRVTANNDPTAHAEVMAIRNACQNRQNFLLEDCVIYTSCEPCPMCLGAIYWAHLKGIYYSATRYDAADAGFSDEFIYQELEKPLDKREVPMTRAAEDSAAQPFTLWKSLENKTEY